MKKYNVIFSDLDGTLIKTISGETFPKGIWDMQIRFEVLDKIKEVKPEYLLIVSNQGGIKSGFVDADVVGAWPKARNTQSRSSSSIYVSINI